MIFRHFWQNTRRRNDHGRMALCSVLHHIPPRISAADSCRRRPTLWPGWSPQRAGLRLWSTECRSQTGDIRTKVAQDAGTAGEYFWAINTPDNRWTLRIRKNGKRMLCVIQKRRRFYSSWINMNGHTDAWSPYIFFSYSIMDFTYSPDCIPVFLYSWQWVSQNRFLYCMDSILLSFAFQVFCKILLSSRSWRFA